MARHGTAEHSTQVAGLWAYYTPQWHLCNLLALHTDDGVGDSGWAML